MKQPVQTEPDDLPPPDAVLTIIRTGVQALCVALGRRKAEVFLREWVRIAATEQSISLLFPIRERGEREAQAIAQREALAWLRQVLPAMISSLPAD